MPDIVRTPQLDPLAEKFYNLSPQSFLNNNPLSFIDPTGMSSSPIYDHQGTFLGTDSEGFKGEAIFMSRSTFNILGGYNNGTDGSQKGGISHESAMAVGQTLDGVIGNNPSQTFTQGEISMVNNAITHMVSQTDGMKFGMSDLHNGKTSSYFALPDASTTNGFDYIVRSANDGNPYTFTNPDAPANMGDKTMTFNLTSNLWSGKGFTVNNIQNAAVHEGNGHFVKGITGEGKGHAKAFQMQFDHSSWQGTTKDWKKEMKNSFNLINQGKL